MQRLISKIKAIDIDGKLQECIGDCLCDRRLSTEKVQTGVELLRGLFLDLCYFSHIYNYKLPE